MIDLKGQMQMNNMKKKLTAKSSSSDVIIKFSYIYRINYIS